MTDAYNSIKDDKIKDAIHQAANRIREKANKSYLKDNRTDSKDIKRDNNDSFSLAFDEKLNKNQEEKGRSWLNEEEWQQLSREHNRRSGGKRELDEKTINQVNKARESGLDEKALLDKTQKIMQSEYDRIEEDVNKYSDYIYGTLEHIVDVTNTYATSIYEPELQPITGYRNLSQSSLNPAIDIGIQWGDDILKWLTNGAKTTLGRASVVGVGIEIFFLGTIETANDEPYLKEYYLENKDDFIELLRAYGNDANAKYTMVISDKQGITLTTIPMETKEFKQPYIMEILEEVYEVEIFPYGEEPKEKIIGGGTSIQDQSYEDFIIYVESMMGQNGRNIVGSTYNNIRPTQDIVNPEKVAEYANKLKAGEYVEPIEVVEIQGKGMYILEGHHRFVASQLTDVPIEIIVREGNGPIGLPDWSEVEWKEFINDDQFWGE